MRLPPNVGGRLRARRAQIISGGGQLLANVALKWDSVEFLAAATSGWIAFKKAVDLPSHQTLLSNRTVYVIRTMRPFALYY